MKVCVYGAGAIGGYVGGSLAAAGQAVTFIVRPSAAAQWRANGLRLEVAGAGPAQPLRHGFVLVESVAEALGRGADCLALAVKSYDTPGAIEAIRAGAAEAGAAVPPILCLQNGVDNEAALATAFGRGSVIAGTVTTPVSKPAEGHIIVERPRGVGIALGHALSQPLLAALAAAGLRARGYPAAGPMKWSKLFTNLVGNATAAIVDWPVRAVLADPRLFALEAQALRECLSVMRAQGFGVVDLPGVPVRLLALAFTRLPRGLARPLLQRAVGGGRGGKMPSLHQDVHAGRGRTEAPWLNGAVARHGAALGVPAPVNQALADAVEALAAGRLDPAQFRGKPESLLSLVAHG